MTEETTVSAIEQKPLDLILKSCENHKNDRKLLKKETENPEERLAIIPKILDPAMSSEEKENTKFLFQTVESQDIYDDDEMEDIDQEEEEYDAQKIEVGSLPSTSSSSEDENEEEDSSMVSDEEEEEDEEDLDKKVKNQPQDYSKLLTRLDKLCIASLQEIAKDTVTLNFSNTVKKITKGTMVDHHFAESKIKVNVDDELTPEQVAQIMETCYGCDVRTLLNDEEVCKLAGFKNIEHLKKCTKEEVPYDHVLFPVRSKTFFFFLTGCVYKTCMKNREKNKLKENPRLVTRSNHPILRHCVDRDPFLDFFEGCEKEDIKYCGVNMIWKKLATRVSKKSGQIMHPVGHLCIALEEARSISWTEATIPEKYTDEEGVTRELGLNCAITGKSLSPGEKVHVVNIKTAHVSGAPQVKPNTKRSKKNKKTKKEEEEQEEEDESMPTAEYRNNSFFITASDPSPFCLFQVMTTVAQMELVLHNKIVKWMELPKYFNMIPENCDPEYVANLLLMEDEAYSITEWFSYLINMCYILDKAIPDVDYDKCMPKQ